MFQFLPFNLIISNDLHLLMYLLCIHFYSIYPFIILYIISKFHINEKDHLKSSI